MVNIEVRSRSKSLLGLSTNELSLDDPVSALAELISESNKDISVNRLRITINDAAVKKQIPLESDKSFIDNGVPRGAPEITLYVKDLGPQIAWKTVFLVEYLGPLLLHPLFYHFTSIYSTAAGVHTQTQKLAYAMVLLHFLKREYETMYVHSFSQATMPIFNIFKNSSHYWILSGFNLAFFIYSPNFATGSKSNAFTKFLFYVNDLPTWANALLVLGWIFAEVSNFKTHLILASLRSSDPKAPKKHVIPYGYGFNLVSFPNYFFESLGWLFFAVLTNNWSAWLFLAISSGQMFIWAEKKHKRYLKTFGDEYKKLKRTAFIPYVI
ncbi:very-long-chain enoyl-CoA reductase [[Candida] anglica]|uniref:Very-long-chain enoyl-CoA reductase n=1 Tax=[Candida] anglica TaxID=148631 RepID=A0ABP0EHT6_9ASCO